MSEFYSPYQFVPVTGKINGEKVVQDYDAIKKGVAKNNPQARHDIWYKEGKTGRIICSLYLNTPTVIGNEHITDKISGKKRIHQYQWKSQPAISANTIKGMISSLTEALSQSTLRVLDPDNDKKMRIKADTRIGTRQVSVPNSVYQYFDNIDEDLKPWQGVRNDLTPAEIIFGTVEVNDKDESTGSGRSLSGRVRFSDALTDKPAAQMPEVTLKVLSEPRTPCPAMYYHVKEHRGEYLSKEQMHEYPEHNHVYPNGRKFYLHHPLQQINNNYWESTTTARDEHKFLCSPLESGQTFYFHLDFQNLSDAELGLLTTALMPSSSFQNKIGLGKGLGLGSVTHRIEGVFFKDQKERYSIENALNADVYQQAWLTEKQSSSSLEVLTKLYPLEYANEWEQGELPNCKDLVDISTLEIVNTIGNPDMMADGLPVRTPILSTQEATPEKETFKWFNENDKDANQAMPVVIPNSQIPFLYANMEDAKKSKRFNNVNLSFIDMDEPTEIIEDIPQFIESFVEQQKEDITNVLVNRPLAQFIEENADKELQKRLLDWLKKYWEEKNNFPTNSARKIYDKFDSDLNNKGNSIDIFAYIKSK